MSSVAARASAPDSVPDATAAIDGKVVIQRGSFGTLSSRLSRALPDLARSYSPVIMAPAIPYSIGSHTFIMAPTVAMAQANRRAHRWRVFSVTVRAGPS